MLRVGVRSVCLETHNFPAPTNPPKNARLLGALRIRIGFWAPYTIIIIRNHQNSANIEIYSIRDQALDFVRNRTSLRGLSRGRRMVTLSHNFYFREPNPAP